MSNPSIDAFRKKNELPTDEAVEIESKRQTAMVKGLEHSQDADVKTVVAVQ